MNINKTKALYLLRTFDSSSDRENIKTDNCSTTGGIVLEYMINEFNFNLDNEIHFTNTCNSNLILHERLTLNNTFNYVVVMFEESNLNHVFTYIVNNSNVHIFQSYVGRYYFKEKIVSSFHFKQKFSNILSSGKQFFDSYNFLFDTKLCSKTENKFVEMYHIQNNF